MSNKIAKRTDLTPSDKLIYALMETLGHTTRTIYAKNPFIAETLGISIDTVKRSLKRLKDFELITIVKPNQYRVIKLPDINKTQLKNEDLDLKLDRIFNLIK